MLYIELNRPAKLNALRRVEVDALTAILREPGDVRAVVLAGAGGRAFSAGMDVAEFLALDQRTARDFITALRDLIHTVRTLPATTICAIDGHCLGGAFELALACDIRVVTTRSTYGLPEIKLGIPSVIDAALLPQFIGLGFAKEMIMTGDLYPATEPRAAALANQLVEPDQLTEQVSTFLSTVSGHTSTVLAAQKRIFEDWQNNGLTVAAQRSIEEFAGVFAQPDTHQALASYQQNLRTSPPPQDP